MRNWIKSILGKGSQTQTPVSKIEKITLEIKEAMDALIANYAQEKHSITHYGADDIHPRHLVYWICVDSDEEKERLIRDNGLYKELRKLLVTHDYPISGRDEVHIGFESQETVDRESNGNWYHHWK